MRTILHHIRHSLSLKLSFGALLLTSIIFATALSILFYQSRYLVKQSAIERCSAELFIASKHLENMLATVETAANSNKWLICEHLQPDSLLALSRRIVALNANINGCSITTEPWIFPQYGRYFSAYSIREGDSIITVREKPYEYFEKISYKTPREKGEACWVAPYNDYNEGTLSAKDMIASYCVPIRNARGKFIGVITTDISLPILSKIADLEKPYPDSYFVMTDHEGRFFMHPDSTDLERTVFDEAIIKKQKNTKDMIVLGHEVTTGARGSMQISFSDVPCLVCYQPIKNTKWSIILVCPENSVLRRYNNLSFIIIPLITLGFFAIFLFCRNIIKQSFKPLKILVKQSKRISEGFYNEPLPRTKRIDAIGVLQNSFVDMQASINKHISEIEEVNANTLQRNNELEKAHEMVEESSRQKMAFIQDMSHQIRTPLNIIMGFSQVLRENKGEMTPEEVHPIITMIQRNSETLSRMINMLYDSSDAGFNKKKESFIFEDVSCNKIARESITTTQQHFPDVHIAFKTELPDDFTIHTCQAYVMRCLRELLYNAVKHSDGQNIILEISTTMDTDMIRFIIQDTGTGISEKDRDRIFKPFTKVSDLTEGLGLGLSLVQRYISTLEGNLCLDASYHDGCRFIVELPLGKK